MEAQENTLPRGTKSVLETAALEGIAEAISLAVMSRPAVFLSVVAGRDLTVEDEAQRLLDEALERQGIDTAVPSEPRVLRALAALVQTGIGRLAEQAA